MPHTSVGDVLHFLRKSLSGDAACDLTDGELLKRFVQQRDQAAANTLVQRHGPLVLGVCRRVLGDGHDAEDAFQATFIVLVRRAGSIPRRVRLGGWLHGVAQRIAYKVRAQAAGRRRRERQHAPMACADMLDDLTWRELRTVLDEEIARLPEKYRTPLVLCYFEGKNYQQAARELGLAKSSLGNRIVRGRELLRQQLVRRGMTLSAGVLATVLCEKGAGAAVPALLTINTVKAAALVAAGKTAAACLSARALAMAEEAVAGMVGIKGTLVVMVLVIGLAIGGVGWARFSGQAEKPQEAKVQAPEAKNQADVQPKRDLLVATDQYGDPLPEGVVARLGTKRFRHDDIFSCQLAYTPDGKTLVGRSSSGVILWDAVTGKERRRLHGPLQNLLSNGNGIAVSPDGTTLAISDSGPNVESKISLWELATGKKTRTLSLPKAKDGAFFYHVCYAPDGKSLVWGDQGQVVVFDVGSGQVRLFMGDRDSLALYNYAISPDSKTLAAAVQTKDPNPGERRHSVQIWDMATGKVIRTIQALPPRTSLEANVSGLAFSPDNKRLAFGFKERIYLCDPATGNKIAQLETKMGQVFGLAFSRDGKKLVSTDGKDKALVWDLVTGKILHSFEGQGQPSLSPDDSTVALPFHNTVRLWDINTGKELCPEYEGHRSQIWELAYSADGKTLVSKGMHVLCWDPNTKERKRMFPWEASSVSFSPDGKMMATLPVERSNKVRIWDSFAGKEALELSVPDGYFYRVIFSADGRKLFTLDENENRACIRQWDVGAGKQEQQWITPRRRYLLLTPDGNPVNTDSKDGGIRVYDKELAREKVLDGQDKSVWHVVYSPDARLLAAGTKKENRDIRLWEIATGKTILNLTGNQGDGGGIAWSPDGRLLAGGDRRRRHVTIFGGNPNQVGDMVLLQTLKDFDQKVRLWDTATGKELKQFGGFQADVLSLAFSPNGTFLAAGLSDTTILIWDVSKIDSKLALAPKLGADEFKSAWTALASNNPTQAHEAIWKLVISPRESLPFLQDRLKPIAAVHPGSIQKWIADLDSDQFAVRNMATTELEKAGKQAQAPIQKALKGNDSLETRRRLEQILKALPDVPGRETLRTIRAIMSLERIGSPEAQAVLETLARGAPGARETEEAKASLQRLTQRSSR